MPKLTDDRGECAFMDELASLMLPWGWPRNVGRMYGYLLLSSEPVTLDKIATGLRIAKSNASVAARMLEQFGNARRHSEPGSKRIYYSAPESLAGPFASKAELFDRIVRLLTANSAIGRTDAVNLRLEDMAGFYRDMRDAVQGVIDRYAQADSDTRDDAADAGSSRDKSSATRAR